jgi:hypothetical protein
MSEHAGAVRIDAALVGAAVPEGVDHALDERGIGRRVPRY